MTINFRMQIDTGEAVSVMSMVNYEQLWPLGNGPTLKPTYAKFIYHLLRGCFEDSWHNDIYQNQKCQLPVVIVDTPGPTLLGRSWLSQIQLD